MEIPFTMSAPLPVLRVEEAQGPFASHPQGQMSPVELCPDPTFLPQYLGARGRYLRARLSTSFLEDGVWISRAGVSTATG